MEWFTIICLAAFIGFCIGRMTFEKRHTWRGFVTNKKPRCEMPMPQKNKK